VWLVVVGLCGCWSLRAGNIACSRCISVVEAMFIPKVFRIFSQITENIENKCLANNITRLGGSVNQIM
jgi:hypothetical protein